MYYVVKWEGILSTIAGVIFAFIGLYVLTAHADELCPAAKKQWLDYADPSALHILFLDVKDCNEQVKYVDKITRCAEDYMAPNHPVYDQGIALSACSGHYKFAHLYLARRGKPYPAHEATDLARLGDKKTLIDENGGVPENK